MMETVFPGEQTIVGMIWEVIEDYPITPTNPLIYQTTPSSNKVIILTFIKLSSAAHINTAN